MLSFNKSSSTTLTFSMTALSENTERLMVHQCRRRGSSHRIMKAEAHRNSGHKDRSHTDRLPCHDLFSVTGYPLYSV